MPDEPIEPEATAIPRRWDDDEIWDDGAPWLDEKPFPPGVSAVPNNTVHPERGDGDRGAATIDPDGIEKRSRSERITLVLRAVPLAKEALQQLIDDTEAQRPNDPTALNTLRELHNLLGEVIDAAEQGVDPSPWLEAAQRQATNAITMSDEAFRGVARSPTLTIAVLLAVGYLFGLDWTMNILSGLAGAHLKTVQKN